MKGLSVTEHLEPEYRSDNTVEYLYGCGDDRTICLAAMVSSNPHSLDTAGELSPEKVNGLIRSLIRKKHGTPFEHNSMTFFVEAPLFVFREWHRHRIGFSYNEASARYQKKMRPVFWIPREGRPLIKTGKAMDPVFVAGTEDQVDMTQARLKTSYEQAWRLYEGILEDGIANEVARAALPVGLYSSMWVTCNARSMMNFLSLRTHEPTAKFPSKPQLEIEECARKLEKTFASRFPITYAAFCEFGRVGP